MQSTAYYTTEIFIVIVLSLNFRSKFNNMDVFFRYAKMLFKCGKGISYGLAKINIDLEFLKLVWVILKSKYLIINLCDVWAILCITSIRHLDSLYFQTSHTKRNRHKSNTIRWSFIFHYINIYTILYKYCHLYINKT